MATMQKAPRRSDRTPKQEAHRQAAAAWQEYYEGRPKIIERSIASLELFKAGELDKANRATRRKYVPNRRGRRA